MHFELFEDWIVQIPDPSGQNGVQTPCPKEQCNCRRLLSSVIRLVYICGWRGHLFKESYFRRCLRGTVYALN